MRCKITWVLAVILTALLSAGSFAENIDTGVCVEADGFTGVVVSRIITNNAPQSEDYKEKWCFVYTATGLETVAIEDLKAISCRDALDSFPLERKLALGEWIEGGVNPMLLDR